jgi:hypothetical protein
VIRRALGGRFMCDARQRVIDVGPWVGGSRGPVLFAGEFRLHFLNLRAPDDPAGCRSCDGSADASGSRPRHWRLPQFLAITGGRSRRAWGRGRGRVAALGEGAKIVPDSARKCHYRKARQVAIKVGLAWPCYSKAHAFRRVPTFRRKWRWHRRHLGHPNSPRNRGFSLASGFGFDPVTGANSARKRGNAEALSLWTDAAVRGIVPAHVSGVHPSARFCHLWSFSRIEIGTETRARV